MINSIKITLSILFLLCLARMPYGYYQFVRFLAFVGFVVLAYKIINESNKTELIIYCALALLFQPFIKISLGRQMWNFIDVIVAIGLITSIFFNAKKTKV